MEGQRRERLWQIATDRMRHREPGTGWVGVVVTVVVEEIEVDGAAISLRTAEGEQELVAASGPWAESLEEVQYVVGEGPGVEAISVGGPVLVSDLTVDEQRWPGFADGASASGAMATFAFPLQVGAIRLGTLDLYRRTPGSLDPDDLASALVLADLATTALLTDSRATGDHAASWTRDDVAGYYDDVNMATGMLATELRISLEDALLRLRARAFTNRMPITEVARAVLGRQLRFDSPQD